MKFPGKILLTIGVEGKCWSEVRNVQRKIKSGAAIFLAFLARFGSGLGSGPGVGLGLSLRAYLDPTRKCFLARNDLTAGPLEAPYWTLRY